MTKYNWSATCLILYLSNAPSRKSKRVSFCRVGSKKGSASLSNDSLIERGNTQKRTESMSHATNSTTDSTKARNGSMSSSNSLCRTSSRKKTTSVSTDGLSRKNSDKKNGRLSSSSETEIQTLGITVLSQKGQHRNQIQATKLEDEEDDVFIKKAETRERYHNTFLRPA